MSTTEFPGLYIVPLFAGYTFHLASAFTFFYCQRWGAKRGSVISAIFRNILGIPFWSIGFLLAIRLEADRLYSSHLLIFLFAWLVMINGSIIIAWALSAIRKKAAIPSSDDLLVDTGIYSIIRHPIHVGTFLEFVGVFLLFPTIPVAFASISGMIWLHFQSRFEEFDLIRRIPGYRDYQERVPRLIPRYPMITK